MAQLEANVGTDNIDAVIKELEKADLFTDANLQDMLTAGSEIMLSAVKSAFVAAGHNRPGVNRRTGETLRHITKTRTVKKDKHGVPYVQVTITGKDRRNQRYGVKGFVLNYGRRKGGKIAGDYYWSQAVKNTWTQVNEKMSEIAAQKLKGE